MASHNLPKNERVTIMKLKTTSKKTRTKKKARTYNTSVRNKKSEISRQKIIGVYINLLVSRRGQEISLDDLAKKSKVSVRTLFRFFGDKQSLHQELDIYLQQYQQAASIKLSQMSYEDYSSYLYKLFDEYEDLFRAYLYTNFGQTSRLILRKKFNKLLFDKLLTQIDRKFTPVQVKRLYLIVLIVNANIWIDMKDSFSVTGEQMSETIKWAVKTLIKGIQS